MTRLPERLPAALAGRLASASNSIYSRQGREVDVAVGGIPFRLATFSELPQAIETIPVRKDQFDAENDPGEQSLTSWWRRSQASWHEGAGSLYQESSDSNVASNGFYDSEGVDVFTPGQVTLIKAMKSAAQAAVAYSRVRYASGGTVGASAVGGGALHTSPDADGSYASLHAPAAKTIVDGLVAGADFYDIASDGSLYEGTVAAPGAATTWPLGDTTTRLAWGKHRLWVIGGRKLWQPDLSLAGGTAQPAIFTHPNKGWNYTCLAEGPSAMYFGGHDGNSSSIQAVTLDSGGGLPTLTGAAVTATLPDGELVQEIATIAGQYIGIGTSRGFRVGVMGTGGTISYGPLLIEPTGVVRCSAIGTQGRFFLVAFDTVDNNAIAYRVDTGTQIAEGVFPYAKDISLGTGTITSIAAASGSQLLATSDAGIVYYQSSTEYVASGYIQSGRIRFRTTEPKQFRYLNMEIQPLMGGIACELILEGGSTLPLGSVTSQGSTFEDKFSIQQGAMKYASVKLTLTPNVALTGAPVINSYLVRALPAVAPQRMITLPLLCYDQEQARSGQRYGGKGFAKDRLTAMQILEDAAETLIFQDFTDTTASGRLVVIESMRFTQTAPAQPVRAEGAGGILLLQLRTVDA
jgi:hypothetical protein